MRILGIDPGLQTTGFGVIDVEGSKLTYVASGVIKTDKVQQGNLPNRLKVIYDGIVEINQRYQPNAASVEILFKIDNCSTFFVNRIEKSPGKSRSTAVAPLNNWAMTGGRFVNVIVVNCVMSIQSFQNESLLFPVRRRHRDVGNVAVIVNE